jgi:tRNA(fMet)-specific endonuclease VapC
VPVLLDTDYLSILHWQEQPACDRLLARLDQLPADDIATSIVSFQEQVQGWMAYLNRAKKPAQIVEAYAKLESLWRSFLRMNVLSFTAEAQATFAEVRRQVPRIETMDARIAATALATNSTLLSRNLRHFRGVPGLVVEDWTT